MRNKRSVKQRTKNYNLTFDLFAERKVILHEITNTKK